MKYPVLMLTLLSCTTLAGDLSNVPAGATDLYFNVKPKISETRTIKTQKKLTLSPFVISEDSYPPTLSLQIIDFPKNKVEKE